MNDKDFETAQLKLSSASIAIGFSRNLEEIEVPIEPETLAWFQLQGETAAHHLAAALRTYAAVQANSSNGAEPLELAYRQAIEMAQFKAGFLARTSHELRSPLNGLIGALQLVLEDLCESPEEEREFLAQANESALKMVGLLDEIINVAKAEYGTGKLTLQPLSLVSVLENVYGLTHLLAKNRNLRFEIAMPDPDIQIVADRRSLEQALTSLISSAIATMQEGNLSLSVQSSPDFAHIQIEDDRPLETWREAIDLLHTGTSFNQVSSPSIGFSLLLSQTLIELMHGRFELLTVPTGANETVTRIQCAIPRSTVE